MAAQVLDWQL